MSYPTLGSYGYGQLGLNNNPIAYDQTALNNVEPQQQPISQQTTMQKTLGDIYQTLMGKQWNTKAGVLPQLSDTFGMLGNTLGSIFGVWNAWQGIQLANKQLDLFDNQLQIAKEQWANTKAELDYIRRARRAFANRYLGK